VVDEAGFNCQLSSALSYRIITSHLLMDVLCIIAEDSEVKKAKSRRSRSAPSNQPNIAEMFAKRCAIWCILWPF